MDAFEDTPNSQQLVTNVGSLADALGWAPRRIRLFALRCSDILSRASRPENYFGASVLIAEVSPRVADDCSRRQQQRRNKPQGDVTGDRPGGFDFVGGAKYDAWFKLKGVTRDDAMTGYMKQVDKLTENRTSIPVDRRSLP